MFNFVFGAKAKRAPYPRQFWLLLSGVFVNRASFGMIWPFLTVFLQERLVVALTIVTLLLSLRSLSSLIATSFITPLMDRFGRKRAMVVGLSVSAVLFVGMCTATTIPAWAVLMLVHGMVMPMFNIGVYAMVADIIQEDNRPNAYALIRVVANAGIAIGPIIGGLIAVVSFEAIFVLTALVFAILAVFIALYVPESGVYTDKPESEQGVQGGYRFLLRDRPFLSFIGAYLLMEMAAAHIFAILPAYVARQYNLAESQYGLLLTINALMVVFLQYTVTRFTKHHPPLKVMAVGALFYAVGTWSIVGGSTFAHFALSMVVVTIGELIVSPTTLTLVANYAPADMRARYMGVLEVIYPVASGIGPVIGGLLNDNIAPVAMWYGAGTMAFLGALGFWWLFSRQSVRNAVSSSSSD